MEKNLTELVSFGCGATKATFGEMNKKVECEGDFSIRGVIGVAEDLIGSSS